MSKLAEHIVSGYDEDLDTLTTRLSEMGNLAENMVSDAIRSVKKRDDDLAQSVITRDKDMNKLQSVIDEDAMRILALRHPMATDLRRTIGAIRIANDLERIGDLAEGIARRAISLNEIERIELAKGVTRMGKLVKGQLSRAIDAYLRDDIDSAVAIWMGDEDIDEMYNSIFRELLTYMMGDPRMIGGCASLLFVAKNLERIGDQTTNICEVVYFTANGKPLIEDERVERRRETRTG